MTMMFYGLAKKYRNRSIFWDKGKRISHEALVYNIDHLAFFLEKVGVKESDRVCISLPNSSEFVASFFAAQKIGAIPVLVDPGLSQGKISYILRDSGARVFISRNLPDGVILKISDREVCAKVYWPKSEAVVSTIIDDLATILYTSGTTGDPKGVMLSSHNLEYTTRIIVDTLKLVDEDMELISMSFSHCAGLLHLLAQLRAGASSLIGENPAFLGDFLKAAQAHEVTILPSVPSFFSFLLGYRAKKITQYLGKLRIVEVSSAPLTTSLAAKMLETFAFAKIYNTYGLTEAPRITYHHISDNLESCVGLPNPGIEIEILPGGENRRCYCGEIAIRGPNVALGYWNNSRATRENFAQSSFKTGDIGFFDNGYLFLRGRNDNMIKIGADKVYPEEVEAIVCRFPGVIQALVYPSTDPIYGNLLCLKVVQDKKSFSKTALRAYCRKNLEKYKIPAKIEFCDSIPLSTSGKVKREKP